MKIIITGSLGNISKPLTEELIRKGHEVTVVSSNSGRIKDIKETGAHAAIGQIEDIDFLTAAFSGADAVFSMTPLNYSEPDVLVYADKMARCFAAAIYNSGVKRVVRLSSYGAHLPSGTGFIAGSYIAEQVFNTITDVDITYIRPTFFYYNLLAYIPMIKATGFIGSVYGEDDKLALVSPKDIALAIAEEITKTQDFARIRYVYSDDMTCNEAALILGKAIGKPDLQWKILPAERVKEAFKANGLPEKVIDNVIELSQAIHTGILREDFELHQPAPGQVKLEDFANEFAMIYNR